MLRDDDRWRTVFWQVSAGIRLSPQVGGMPVIEAGLQADSPCALPYWPLAPDPRRGHGAWCRPSDLWAAGIAGQHRPDRPGGRAAGVRGGLDLRAAAAADGRAAVADRRAAGAHP